MIGAELLICSSVSGKFSVSWYSQLKSSLIQSAGGKPSVTPTKGSRQPVWGEQNAPQAALLPFSTSPLWLMLTPAPAACSSSSHPSLLCRTWRLLLITLATGRRGCLLGCAPASTSVPRTSPLSFLPKLQSVLLIHAFHTLAALGFEFVRWAGEGN